MIKITGFDKILKRLDSYQNVTQEKQKELLERLASLGVNKAEIVFKTAQYDGTNDVVVEPPKWIDENTIQIVARGKAVTFIEFGSGVTYSEQHPWASEVGAIRGQYGKGKGKNPSWTYYGEAGTNGKFIRASDKGDVIRTKGNPPARAMYLASKEIKEKILEICKEVYK